MKPKLSLRSFLLAVGSSLLAISSASALDGTWSVPGGLATHNWTDSTMWASGQIADGADFTANFTGIDITGAKTVSLNGTNRTIGNITFTDATNANNNLTISGNILTLDRTDSTAPQINVTNRGLTISSQISGSDGFTKTGAGSLNLTSNSNNYTGVTTISGGRVDPTVANGFGATGAGNHTTFVAGTAGMSIVLQANVAEDFIITGTSTGSNLSANNRTASGKITLDGSGIITIGGGGLTFSGTITQATGKMHALQLTGNNTVNNAMTINGADLSIVAAGSVGTTLSGVNGTGIGNTSINSTGILRLGVNDALNTSADLSFGTSGTNQFNLVAFNQTIKGLISSGGSNTRQVYNSTVSTTSTLTVGNGGGDYSFNGTILNNTGTGGTVALIKTGTGNQTLASTNTYTGGTRIDDGTLTLGHATDTLANGGAVNVNGGTLALGTNTDVVGAVTLTSGSITGTGAGTLTGTSYDVRSGTIGAKLGGSGALTKTTGGTVTISSDNSSSYTGAVNVNGGKLTISSTGNINGTSGVSIGAGEFNYNASTPLSRPVTFSDMGGTLSGSGTINQSITITAGNNLAIGNSVGQMNFGSGLILAGTTVMEIDGTAGAGVTGGNDFANVTGGTLTYGGSMTLDIGMIFGEGSYTWNLFDFLGADSGTFASITLADQYFGSLTDINTDGIWDLTSGVNTWQFTESTGVLGLTVIPEPRAALLGGLGLLALLRRRR